MTLYFVLPVRAGKQGLSQYFFLTLEFNMPQVNITDFACRKAMSFYHFARLRKKKKICKMSKRNPDKLSSKKNIFFPVYWKFFN